MELYHKHEKNVLPHEMPCSKNKTPNMWRISIVLYKTKILFYFVVCIKPLSHVPYLKG